MRSAIFLLLCVVLAVVPAAAVASEKPSDDQKAVAEGSTAFALDLYGKLKAANGNLLFSPYSISTALAMTYAGARGNTAAQMAKTLHFTLPQEKLHSAFGAMIATLQADKKGRGYDLSVANALWGQKGKAFLPEFLDLTKKSYGAGLREVDFVQTEAARKTINDWAQKETRDKIKDLIPPDVLDARTRLVLTNAIYFLGDWVLAFKPEKTNDAPFTLASGEKVNASMMHQSEHFGLAAGDGFRALEMRYKGGELAMIVFLPDKSDGLPALEKSLTPELVAKTVAGLRSNRVNVSLPKFTFTSQFSLADALKSLGMIDAFGNADFSGIDGTKGLFISAVIHKAFIDVNEKGTEAAAATAVVAGKSLASVPVEFRADHPFLFMIRESRAASILFIGRVMNPKEAGES